jgi:lipopolysaccharide transport system permease protein
VPLIIAFLLLTGLGLLLSAINVKYRDISVGIPLLIQLWMFLSPIIYPVDLVPDRVRIFYAFNPLVGIIEAFRAAVLSQALRGSALAIASGISLIVFLISVFVFRRMEAAFADNV